MQMKPNSSAIILAAGASSRMGSPKPLLRIKDHTLLEDQVGRLKKADCHPIIVVVGSEAKVITEHHKELDVIWAVNNDWEKGHFSSILCGLKTLSSSDIIPSFSDPSKTSSFNFQPEADPPSAVIGGSILLPVDTVDVPVAVIKEILAKGLTEEKNIIPTFDNRGGHPVFLTIEFIQQTLKTATPNDRLDHILRDNDNTLRLEVSSHAVLNNINTPDDWKTPMNP